MTAVAAAQPTPTVTDALAAAEAIAVMGGIPHVQRVLLFGSVARGSADDGSDIDLVVVVDDLGDYSGRRELRFQMAETARRAVQFQVDVHVTDPPEWRCRTTEVTASFEASLKSELLPLLERPARTEPDWEKPMAKPADNLGEAARRFQDIASHLSQLNLQLRSGNEEPAEDSWTRDVAFKNRKRFICGHAADAIENAVKTVIALGAVSPPRRHDLGDLAQMIHDPRAFEQISAILSASGVPLNKMSEWHVKANYSNEIEDQWVDAASHMPGMIRTAHTMAAYVSGLFREAGGDVRAINMLQMNMSELEEQAAAQFDIHLPPQ